MEAVVKEDPNRKKDVDHIDEEKMEEVVQVKPSRNLDDSDDEDTPKPKPKEAPQPKQAQSTDQNLRNYDISITFDRYHQCPRLWLAGTNNKGVPLTNEEIFEDVMSDYANKTVTIEDHPHLGISSLMFTNRTSKHSPL